jgi:hypothetical protein
VPGSVTGASIVTVPEWRKVSVSGTMARDSYGDGCWSTVRVTGDPRPGDAPLREAVEEAGYEFAG